MVISNIVKFNFNILINIPGHIYFYYTLMAHYSYITEGSHLLLIYFNKSILIKKHTNLTILYLICTISLSIC